MTARRLLLVAAALAVGASELALWLQVRDSLHAQAQLRREVLEHRCSPAPFRPSGSGPFASKPPVFPFLIDPPALTDPALEGHRAGQI